MSDERVDVALKELAAALSVEPSREFAAEVRARLESEGRTRWARGVAWVVGATAAAAVAAAVWISNRHDVAPSQLPSPPVAAEARVSPLTAPAVMTGQPRARRPSAPPQLEVLVPGDQEIALRGLLVALREGRLSVPPAAEEAIGGPDDLPKPAAIEIPPIKVEPLTAPSTGGGGGKP